MDNSKNSDHQMNERMEEAKRLFSPDNTEIVRSVANFLGSTSDETTEVLSKEHHTYSKVVWDNYTRN